MIIPAGLIGASYLGRSRSVDTQECVNWYPEVNSPGAKSVESLVSTPGYTLLCELIGPGYVRGLYRASNGRKFAVRGNVLNEVVNHKPVQIGIIDSVEGCPVSMADNGWQLIIADGRAGYCYDLTDWNDPQYGINHLAGGFQRIETQDWTYTAYDQNGNPQTTTITSEFPPQCTHIAFKDGYFVGVSAKTQSFRVSQPYDGMIWDASIVGYAEGSPDNIAAMVHTNNELWFFGDDSTEVFYFTGDALQPFSRISGAFIDIGTAAKYSPASNGKTVFWLGSNDAGHGTVWSAAGFHPKRISTHAIEYIIGQMPVISDAVGWCYQQEGHEFYILTFPNGNRTLVYDVTTGLWHERGTWDPANGQMNAWAPIFHALWDEVNYVGDSTSGNLYRLSLDIGTENTAIIRRVRTFPHEYAFRMFRRKIFPTQGRQFFNSLEIDMQRGLANQEAGVAPTAGVIAPPGDVDYSAVIEGAAGSDPHVMLQYSDDGGYTWSREYWHGTGKIGKHRERVHWHRLGGGVRDRVFRVVYTSVIPTVLIGATLDVTFEKE